MVGSIVKVGKKVHGMFAGDRVAAIGLNIGGNSQYIIIGSQSLVSIPSSMEAVDVVCLLQSYVAAYQCLHRAGTRRYDLLGKRILVTGGCGRIGQAVVQLAQVAGAKKIYATGGDLECKHLLETIGAKNLNRDPQEWLPVVEGKMDLVVDTVFLGRCDSCYKALNRTGKLVCVGSASALTGAAFPSIHSLLSHVHHLIAKIQKPNQTVFYDLFESYQERPDIYEKDLQELFSLLRKGLIQPSISACIPLHNVSQAHENIEEGGVHGAVICLPLGRHPERLIEKIIAKV